jgi:hypothetical protein
MGNKNFGIGTGGVGSGHVPTCSKGKRMDPDTEVWRDQTLNVGDLGKEI